jgi:hypothetical protein
MKLLKQTFFINILILLLIGSIGVLGYYGYMSYARTGTPAKNTKVQVVLQKVSSTLEKLEDERINTSAYLATHSQSNYMHMLRSRKPVDEMLFRLNDTVRSIPSLSSYKEEARSLLGTLKSVREAIESSKSSTLVILYGGYHNKIYKPIEKLVDSLALEEQNRIRERYIRLYQSVLMLKENSLLESTLTYTLLLQKRPMTREERTVLGRLMSADRLPRFSLLEDDMTAVELQTLMPGVIYRNMLRKEREQLMLGADTGKYKVDIIEWLGKYEKRMAYYHNLEGILQKRIKELTQKQTVEMQIDTIMFSVALLLFGFFLYRLFSLRKEIKMNRHLDKETLRDIELVFSSEQQKKLKRLI